MAVLSYAPDIEKKLEFSAIDTYLVKHKILTIEECYQEYQKPFQIGQVSNADLVRKLLPKIEKNPRRFYQALEESVNDPDRQIHENHMTLLKLLPRDMGKKRSLFNLKKKGKNKKSKSKVKTTNETSSSDAGKQSRSEAEDEESSENTMESLPPPYKTLPYCTKISRRNSTHSLDPSAFHMHHNMDVHDDKTPTASLYGSAVNLEQRSTSLISPTLHAELKLKTEQMVIEALQKHHGTCMGAVTQETQQVDTDSSYHSPNEYHHVLPEKSPKSVGNKESKYTIERNTSTQRFTTTHTVQYSPTNRSLDSTLLQGSKQLRTASLAELGSKDVGLQSLPSAESNYTQPVDSKLKHTEDVNKSQEKKIQCLHQQLQTNFTSLQEEHKSAVHQLEEQRRALDCLLQQTEADNKELASENGRFKEKQQQNQLLLRNQACEIKNMESTIQDYSKELQKTNHAVQYYKEHISELQKQLTEVKDTSEKNVSEIMLQMQTEKEIAAKDQEILHAKNLEVVMDDFRQQLQRMGMEKASLVSKCNNLEKVLTESQQTSENIRAENSSLKKQLILVHRKDKKTHQLLEASKKETEESVCKSAELKVMLNELQQKHVVLQNQNTAEVKRLEATIKHLHSNLVQLGNDKKQAVKTIGSLNYQLQSKQQVARQKQSELEAELIKQKKDLIQALILHIPNTMNIPEHKLNLQKSTTGSCTMGQVYIPSSLSCLAIASLKTSQLHEQSIHESINERCVHMKLPKSGIYKFTTGGQLYILFCFLVYMCLILI